MVLRADLRLPHFFKFINSSWSESHPNASITLLHASNSYSTKVEVYNRGIISVRGLGDGTLAVFISLVCPVARIKVSSCGVGPWLLLGSLGMEGGTAALYF